MAQSVPVKQCEMKSVGISGPALNPGEPLGLSDLRAGFNDK
jgi:hypothetical protein